MKTLVLALLAVASAATAQDGLVVGSGNFFSPIVGDLDRAIAFYHDGLGLDIQGSPSNAEQNPALRNMFGLPDAHLRWMVGRPPAMRTGVEIVEVSGAEGKPVERRIQDAGAFTLIVLVRDADAAFQKLKAHAPSVVTTGAKPIAVGGAKAFVVKDPDGHFVEVAQLTPQPETTAPESANVIGVRVRLTVEDAGQAMRLYQSLGLSGTMNVIFDKSPALMKLFGLKEDAQYRLAAMDVPTSGLRLEFIEFKGVDRKTVRANIQDPGSTRLQLQVRDVDATIDALKSAGGAVVSTGGTTVGLPGRGGATTKVAIVRDPSNLFLVLIQAAPARTP